MNEALAAVLLIVALFALIALMPDFDGWREGDWERPQDQGRPPRPAAAVRRARARSPSVAAKTDPARPDVRRRGGRSG